MSRWTKMRSGSATQPESVSAAVARLESLTDRLEETTAALKTLLATVKKEEVPPT